MAGKWRWMPGENQGIADYATNVSERKKIYIFIYIFFSSAQSAGKHKAANCSVKSDMRF